LKQYQIFFSQAHNRQFLTKLNIGLEKEGLRIQEDGALSHTAHLETLGSKLTHPFITTDYAESLLEYVTPVFSECQDMLKFLVDLHHYTYLKLDQEFVWPASMPCILPEKDEDIAVADYGSSNTGKLKKLYRIGLGNRYGRKMQSIAGLHFNFSLSNDFLDAFGRHVGTQLDKKSFRNVLYFEMIRNFRRYSWLLVYLFGASPGTDKSFLEGREHDLVPIGKDTMGLPHATSLRMGGLGYTSAAQKEISVCFNRLETYLESLEKARTTSYPDYEKIGVKVDGEYKQLNSNLIQIDNEYYSTIRPKAVAKSGQSALQALWQNGIEYVEVRILDLDPFAIAGISQQSILFMKSFLLYCLMEESPIITSEECDVIDANHLKVVREGRNPNLTIMFDGQEMKLADAARSLLDRILPMAGFMDSAYNTFRHSSAVQEQHHKVNYPESTPSGKLASMIDDNTSFVDGILGLSRGYRNIFLNTPLPEQKIHNWDELARESWEKQRQMEKVDTENFDDFLNNYFEQIKLDW
jgi:glutamate--cysteine ligase